MTKTTLCAKLSVQQSNDKPTIDANENICMHQRYQQRICISKYFFPATNCKNFAVLLSPTTALAINMTWVIFNTIMALYQQLLEVGKGIDRI